MRNQTQHIHDQIAASLNEAGRTDQLNLICPLTSVFRPWVWWFRVFSCWVKSLDSHLWDFHFLSFSHDYSNELYALQWWKLQEAVHVSASYWIQGKFAKYWFFHKSLGFFCHLGISLWVCCVICGAVGRLGKEPSQAELGVCSARPYRADVWLGTALGSPSRAGLWLGLGVMRLGLARKARSQLGNYIM